MKLTKSKLQQIIKEELKKYDKLGALKALAAKAARPVTSRLRTTIPDNPRIELPPVVPQDLGPEDEPQEPNQEPSSKFPPHIDRAMDVLARIPEEQYNKLMANQEVLSFALNQFGPVYDSGMSSDEVYRQIKHLYQAVLS
jgi:hypothetical protein